MRVRGRPVFGDRSAGDEMDSTVHDIIEYGQVPTTQCSLGPCGLSVSAGLVLMDDRLTFMVEILM